MFAQIAASWLPGNECLSIRSIIFSSNELVPLPMLEPPLNKAASCDKYSRFPCISSLSAEISATEVTVHRGRQPETAGYRENLSGGVGSLVTCEIDDRCRNLLGQAHSPQVNTDLIF